MLVCIHYSQLPMCSKLEQSHNGDVMIVVNFTDIGGGSVTFLDGQVEGELCRTVARKSTCKGAPGVNWIGNAYGWLGVEQDGFKLLKW
jgi:hypothetical protein